MTQTTFTDNVLVDGSQDIKQLRVQGHTTQNQPLQTWEDSAGTALAQVTGDGRVQVGDDVGLPSPDALIEAHRLETSTAKPKRGIHSVGRVSGTLATLVQWIVGELELRGSTAIDALHTALRIRATNLNTGTPTANAELRAADVEVIQDATAGAAALPKATGLQVAVTNAAGKTITDAAALRLKVNNAGTITNPYALVAEGQVFIDGSSDQIQQLVQGHSTQTSLLAVWENSSGTDQITFAGNGAAVFNEAGNDADFRVEGDTDPNLIVGDASQDAVGIGTATPNTSAKLHVVSTTKGAISRPVMTAAQVAAISSPAEGLRAYASDTEHEDVYDGQRFRSVASAGWTPRAYPLVFSPSAALSTALFLAANGGSIAIPMQVTGHMLLESVSIRNTDTSLARTWGWDLYEQYLNNGNASENTLTRVASSNGNESYTAAAASTRTLAATAAPVYLAPGLYWLVIQNRHATNNYGFGVTAVGSGFAPTSGQTKTTTNPNGATLDFVAATWVAATAIFGAVLNGRVFGKTAAF